MMSHKDQEQKTFSLKRWTSSMGEGLSQMKAAVKRYPAEFKEKTLPQKMLSLAFGAGVVAASVLTAPAAAGIGALVVHGIGIAAFGGVLLAGRLKDNRHINAVQPVIAFTLTGQKLLLGAAGYAVMAGIAGTRSIVMAALPDDEAHQPMRKKIAYGFAAVGATGVGLTGLFLSPWNFMPMASTLMGTAASALISKHSRYARVLYMIANVNNATYSWFYSGSTGATMVDAMAGVNIGKAMAMHDVPVADREGRPLTGSQRLSSYFGALTEITHESFLGRKLSKAALAADWAYETGRDRLASYYNALQDGGGAAMGRPPSYYFASAAVPTCRLSSRVVSFIDQANEPTMSAEEFKQYEAQRDAYLSIMSGAFDGSKRAADGQEFSVSVYPRHDHPELPSLRRGPFISF